MDAVTYPDPKVSRLIGDSFVPVQVDITHDDPQVKGLIDRFNQMWTPTMIVLDENGKELRRTVGYTPPEEFVPELMLGLGMVKMQKKDFAGAHEIFQKALRDNPNAADAAEALYWSGVSAYKRDNNAESLMKFWKELKERFPDSPWWTKASFIG